MQISSNWALLKTAIENVHGRAIQMTNTEFRNPHLDFGDLIVGQNERAESLHTVDGLRDFCQLVVTHIQVFQRC